MIIFDPGGGEPTQWMVCFSRKCRTAWLEWIPVGHYKHVRAFGCIPHINTWVFFDPALSRTSIAVARGDMVARMIHEFIYEADVLLMPALPRESLRPRIFGWCVPQIAHLLGLPTSALRPDGLWRECLRQGGTIPPDGQRALAPARSAA